MLEQGGSVLLDVYSLNAFEKRTETALYEANLLDGFWSPNRYYGFQNTFKYEKEKVVLDKYTIVEAGRTPPPSGNLASPATHLPVPSHYPPSTLSVLLLYNCYIIQKYVS